MKNLFVLLFILCASLGHAQDRKSISLGYGTGNADFLSSKHLLGSPGLNGKSLNIFSANFQKEVHRRLFIEVGISYFELKYIIEPNFNPNVAINAIQAKVQLLTIPVKLRYELGKYFFVNGGAFVDINISQTDQLLSQHDYSGIGAGIGLGLQHNFSPNLGVFINPQANFHGLIGFQRPPYQIFDAIGTIGLAFLL